MLMIYRYERSGHKPEAWTMLSLQNCNGSLTVWGSCASGSAEDEHHFLFDCPAYCAIRNRFTIIIWGPASALSSGFNFHDPKVISSDLSPFHLPCTLHQLSNYTIQSALDDDVQHWVKRRIGMSAQWHVRLCFQTRRTKSRGSWHSQRAAVQRCSFGDKTCSFTEELVSTVDSVCVDCAIDSQKYQFEAYSTGL